jgi:hypothetical protein
MTPPETNISRYTPDKEAMLNALNLFFEELKETNIRMIHFIKIMILPSNPKHRNNRFTVFFS